jgi:hypothetical protein
MAPKIGGPNVDKSLDEDDDRYERCTSPYVPGKNERLSEDSLHLSC